MPKIHVMNDLLANKIAAGEVVERPASVVKELVENSLDAGASEIEIELQQGGLELIRISDNGFGMEAVDVPLAFERHATSKIRDDRDLFRISSLGFRGEALPSIAAVSKIELKTRQEEDTAGTLVRIEGGKILETGAAAAKKGTEIIVKDLFFNTPARLKYLKTIQTELGHAVDYIEKMSLVRPDVAFRLSHNGRTLLQTPGDGKLVHAVASIYGREQVKQMIEVNWQNYDYRITGMTGFPELNRANRNHATFFVNGRYIKSYQLFNAVQAAYHSLLPINRYPVCVLHIELDPSLTDCNVHPTKLEVRFSEEKDVFQSVQTAVRSVLDTQTFIPKAFPTQKTEIQASATPKEKSLQPELRFDNPIRVKYDADSIQIGNNQQNYSKVQESSSLTRSATFGSEVGKKNQGAYGARRLDEQSEPLEKDAVKAALEMYRPTNTTNHEPMVQPSNLTFGSEQEADQIKSVSQTESADQIEQSVQTNPSDDKEHRVPKFRPVAQVLGMYIIAENEQGLFIIDQHAAHEKVLYERFSKKLAAQELSPLPLLIPLTVDLTPAEAEKLEKQIPLLSEYKLEMERFGGGSFLVRSVPDIWGNLDPQRLTFELIDEILTEVTARDPRAMIEDKVISKSCKSAIKANQWLSMPEMVALCDQLSELENPFTCPHGRPIIIHMTRYDLEKQFKRVM